jgi:hypothetical protein
MRGFVKLTATMLVVALAAAGCGGKDKAPAATTPAPTRTAATATATASAAVTTSPSNADSCQKLESLRGQVASALTGKIDPKLPPSLADLAAKAPAEIRPDAQKIAAVYDQVVQAMQKVDAQGGSSDPDTVAKLQQVLASLNTSQITQAATHIGAWMSKNCAK